jgi:hypothetical protein
VPDIVAGHRRPGERSDRERIACWLGTEQEMLRHLILSKWKPTQNRQSKECGRLPGRAAETRKERNRKKLET